MGAFEVCSTLNLLMEISNISHFPAIQYGQQTAGVKRFGAVGPAPSQRYPATIKINRQAYCHTHFYPKDSEILEVVLREPAEPQQRV